MIWGGLSDEVKAIIQSKKTKKNKKKRRLTVNLAGSRKIMADKQSKLYLSFVSVQKVSKLLSNFSNIKSIAIDGSYSYVVKLAGPVIAKPLHHIISLSIMQQKFPDS